MCLSFVSCNGDLTIDGALNGIIDSYSASTLDSLRMMDLTNDAIYGKSAVSSTGKFSMTLGKPVGTKFSPGTGVTVSDPNTFVSMSMLAAVKSGSLKGVVLKNNFTHSSSTTTVGDAMVMFMYADRPCTVKGTITNGNQSLVYDMNLVKGWNEVVGKVTAYSASASSETVSYSSIIPSDLKYRYISTISYVKRFQIRGLN